MFSERFQILISAEQRRRLERESKARGVSVAALVREAIDARFGQVSREEKIRAAEEIAAMRTGAEISIEEMHEALDQERVANIDPHLDAPSR